MLRLFPGFFHKYKLSLVFQHSLIFLQLAVLCRGQSWGAGSSQTVAALVGDDVTLPCHLEPPVDVYYKTVEWGRLDLETRFVHVWYEGRNLLTNQNPSYKGRTSVSTEKLRHGDLSLTLSAVKHSDNGVYRCYFPPLSKETNVKLIVGSVSSAVITGVKLNNSVLVVQCQSEGWFPQPEMLWLNGEGNPLFAGPTETVKGPNGLFTVSSRITVEESNKDSLICRVRQDTINQIRDTHIQMTAEINVSGSSARIAVILVAFCICFIAICFILYKMLQQKPELKSFNQEDQYAEQQNQLLTETIHNEPKQSVKTLEEQIKTLDALEEQWKYLESLINELKNEQKGMGKNMEETERKLQAAKLVTEQDKAKGVFELIEIIMWSKKQLKEQKQREKELITDAQILLYKTEKLHKNLKTAMAPEEEINDLNQKSHSADGVQRREN